MNLPVLLAEVAAASNEDAALNLARAVGGTRVYFPTRRFLETAADDHWLIRAVGRECAYRITEALLGGVGTYFSVPRAEGAIRKRTILALLEEGKCVNEIARRAGCDSRTVYRYMADRRKKKRLHRMARQAAI